jgi:hypothetical protein
MGKIYLRNIKKDIIAAIDRLQYEEKMYGIICCEFFDFGWEYFDKYLTNQYGKAMADDIHYFIFEVMQTDINGEIQIDNVVWHIHSLDDFLSYIQDVYIIDGD